MASAGEAGAQGRTGGMGKVLARWAPYGSQMEEEISPPPPYLTTVVWIETKQGIESLFVLLSQSP